MGYKLEAEVPGYELLGLEIPMGYILWTRTRIDSQYKHEYKQRFVLSTNVHLLHLNPFRANRLARREDSY